MTYYAPYVAVRHALFSFALVLLLASGCADDPEEPVVQPSPETVGTLSEESQANPLLQDITAIRQAMESSRADDAISGIYEVINDGGEMDSPEGSEHIRAEVPALVATLNRTAPSAQRRVSSLSLRTEAGQAVRTFALGVLASQVRNFNYLADRLRRSETAWGAVLQWGERNNASSRRSGQKLEEFRRKLAPQDRAALDRAVKEVFGAAAGF